MQTTVFFTGGTGLIGSFLVPRLLRTFPDSRVLLLVRSADQQTLNLRLAHLRSWIGREVSIPGLESRIEGVRGDILLDGLGIPRPRLREILKSATHIVHGAATIRFDHPLEEARQINVGGTRRVLALANEAVQRGILKRFLYIGTSSVSGQREGLIYEHELEMGQQFFNTYEQSKCESERLVRDAMDRIPTTIVRPSIVIGDSKSGRTTSFNVVYIPLRLFYRGILDALPGNPDTLMDLVAVDWVDDVIVHLLRTERARGKVCHITAGPGRAVPLSAMIERATGYFEQHAPLSHPRTSSFVTMAEFRRRLERWGSRGGTLLTQLDTLMPYVTVNRLFDSRTTDGLLEGSGIVYPRFETYADRIFQYCLDTNWGKNPS